MGSNFPVLGGAIGNEDVVIHAHLCATYRIQFNLNFRFVDAEELVPICTPSVSPTCMLRPASGPAKEASTATTSPTRRA